MDLAELQCRSLIKNDFQSFSRCAHPHIITVMLPHQTDSFNNEMEHALERISEFLMNEVLSTCSNVRTYKATCKNCSPTDVLTLRNMQFV